MSRRHEQASPVHHNAILAAMHQARKLGPRHLVAAMRLASDCAASHGSSAGVVGSYGEASGAGIHQEHRSQAYRVSEAAQRLEALEVYLHPSQRVLLGELLRHHGRPWNMLQAWGSGSGYRTDDAQRAAGVQRVLDLLDSVADFFGIEAPG